MVLLFFCFLQLTLSFCLRKVISEVWRSTFVRGQTSLTLSSSFGNKNMYFFRWYQAYFHYLMSLTFPLANLKGLFQFSILYYHRPIGADTSQEVKLFLYCPACLSSKTSRKKRMVSSVSGTEIVLIHYQEAHLLHIRQHTSHFTVNLGSSILITLLSSLCPKVTVVRVTIYNAQACLLSSW